MARFFVDNIEKVLDAVDNSELRAKCRVLILSEVRLARLEAYNDAVGSSKERAKNRMEILGLVLDGISKG